MRIRMDAQQAAESFEFDLMKALDPAEMEPKVANRETGELKLVDGKPVYRVNVTVSDREKDQILRDVSLSVRNKPSGKVNKAFDVKLAGTVLVTPYVTSGGRQGFSIVADGLVETGK